MAQVTVSIDGKNFRMACDHGQEPHLESLAAYLDAKITQMRQSFGEIGDLRLTTMAALLVCDELFEERETITKLRQHLSAQDAGDAASQNATATRDAAIAAALDSLTGRIERITKLLAGERGE